MNFDPALYTNDEINGLWQSNDDIGALLRAHLILENNLQILLSDCMPNIENFLVDAI